MYRGRPHPERQLQQGRGALRAESGLRVLFPSSLQFPAVSEHRYARAPAGPANGGGDGAEARVAAEGRGVPDRGIMSSLRYLFADLIGEDDDTPPSLPEDLPAAVTAAASEAIHLLIDYQGTGYAQLYVDRLKRFIGRNGVDDAMLAEIARLLAARMSYEDTIRIAQLKRDALHHAAGGEATSSDVCKFRIDELVGALPAIVADYILDALD